MKTMLSRTVANIYSLIDKNGEFYLQSWYEDGAHQKQVNIATISGTNSYMRVYSLHLNGAIALKKQLNEIAPIDVRLFKDAIEILNDEDKAEIFKRFIVCEQKTETVSHVRSLDTRAVKTLQTNFEIKSKLQQTIGQLTLNVNNLSVNKCKKLQNSLKRIEI